MKTILALLFGAATLAPLHAAPLNCDLSQYRRLPGLTAGVEPDALIIEWEGERKQQLRAAFAITHEPPAIRELAVRGEDGTWNVLGRNLTPELRVTTAIRRTNHGLPESNRWDVFWDVPLNHTNDVRRFDAAFHA